MACIHALSFHMAVIFSPTHWQDLAQYTLHLFKHTVCYIVAHNLTEFLSFWATSVGYNNFQTKCQCLYGQSDCNNFLSITPLMSKVCRNWFLWWKLSAAFIFLERYYIPFCIYLVGAQYLVPLWHFPSSWRWLKTEKYIITEKVVTRGSFYVWGDWYILVVNLPGSSTRRL